MTVVSPVFLAVALLAVVAVHALRGRVRRGIVLLVASLGFAAAALDPISMAGMAVYLLAGFALLRVVVAVRSPGVLPAAVAVAVTLFWLLGENDVALGLPRPEPVVLLGLSYVMFRLVHLLVDVGQGELTEPIGVRGYLGYLLFFPNLLAGPIQRYEHLAPQLAADNMAPPAEDAVHEGMRRVLEGAFLVVVVSGLAHEAFMACRSSPGGISFGLAALAFTVHLYASFAGYMGVIVGLGRLLGLEIPENFDRPWLARNFLDFWSRWHITLSEWFKFYLFNPATKELLRVVDRPAAAPWLGAVGYFLTFFVMGVWHGTGATFVVYGLLLGLGVSLNKAWQIWMLQRLGRRGYGALMARRWYGVAARTLALSWFALALVLLWADLGAVAETAGRLGVGGVAQAVGVVIVAIAAAAGIGAIPVVAATCGRLEAVARRDGIVMAIGVAQVAAIAYYLLAWQGDVPVLIYQGF